MLFTCAGQWSGECYNFTLKLELAQDGNAGSHYHQDDPTGRRYVGHTGTWTSTSAKSNMQSVTLKWKERTFSQTNYDPMFQRNDTHEEDVVESIQCDMAGQTITWKPADDNPASSAVLKKA